MAVELNLEGKVIFDDQLSELIDSLLSVRGVAMVYRMEGNRSWMKVVGEPDLRLGLGRLSERQRKFIEAMVFGNVSQYEVMAQDHMSDEEMFGAMEELKDLLADAV